MTGGNVLASHDAKGDNDDEDDDDEDDDDDDDDDAKSIVD